MTNRDKKDRIRGRMAETGESFKPGPHYRRHIETFWGRWVIEPDPEETRSTLPGHPPGPYYGVAQTRRGRIAVYMAMPAPHHFPSKLDDYDTLDGAQMPADIKDQAAAALGIREVIHRDI